ncbi:hypothetical protein [Flavobacterium sp. NRK1]|uniref:hypothetical protein n=1 Tax=Flavobacterium sp. NRK1 TaxID=2954929 RepID=UPI002093A980|nr:hypothetical protein [Flavobacterium sp. NRK1]MCO6148662.1 hypothetical protein [Flavobacterium sp. NRK1]
MDNKAIFLAANDKITKGDNEGFPGFLLRGCDMGIHRRSCAGRQNSRVGIS